MAGGWYLVRRELIAGRRRAIAIALAVVLATTVGIATAAGARRTASVWAALSATALGVVIGAPIGVVAGFTAWRIIAGRVGIATTTTIPWSPVLLVAAGSAVVATFVSWLPAARAARLHPAATLRGE